MKRSYLRIALAILIAAVPAVAAEPAPQPPVKASAEPNAPAERWSRLADTVFQHYTTEHGFTSGSVTALAQDGDGFLWVGTQGGLLRWDGYRVRRYVSDPKSPDALHDNFIQRLHTDAAGRLWIGTSTAGLARYDRDKDRFVNYPVGADGVGDVSVLGIEDDGAGGLLIATSAGLDRLDPATGTFTHFRHDAADPDSLPDNQLLTVLRDRGGTLWIGSQTGLVRRDAGAAKFERVPLLPDSTEQPVPESLLQDSLGKIWIGTSAHGAFVLDPSTGALRRVFEQGAGANLQTEDVYAIVEARAGEIWLGTFGQGIVAVDAATLAARRIRRDPLLPMTLADDTIWSFHRDRSGLLWTGTGRGLSRLHPDQRAIQTVLGASERKPGLSDPDVISVLPAADGRIWLGLSNNGIDVIDPNAATGVRVGELRPDPAHPATALPREKVLALASESGGDIYIGSVRGLYRADRTGRVVRVEVPDRPATASADALRFVGGSLALGTWSGAVWRLDPSTNSATATVRSKTTDALTDKRVLTLAPAANGDDLWVGTGNGLTRLDASFQVVERILPDAANPTGLAGGYVTALTFDNQGRLWVGTLAGISVLEGREADGRARFRNVPRPPGADSGGIAMLLKDATGKIWASGDSGLIVYDPATYAGRVIHRADGLAIGTYWSGSGAVTPRGELLFGGLGGLTIVHPEKLKPWSYRPPVVATEVRVGGKVTPAARFNGGGNGDGVASAPAAVDPIVLPPDANTVAVEFAALDFSAPERNRYAYRLDGFDADWIATDPSRRLAAYTNLPPGDFTLRIRGSNRDGVFTERELALPIRVLPAWYQSVWFHMLLLLAGITLVYALVRSRTALLRARQHELETKVRERTAQLEVASRALEEASLTDTLTGLRNRRFLTRYLDDDALLSMRRYAEHASGEPPPDADLVFYLIDLDHFKQVNDSHGHAAGDAVLVELASRLRQVFRETDYVVRWGGDEFVVVARGTERTTAPEVAERLRSAIAGEDFVLPDGLRLRKTGSIGFVAFPFLPLHPRASSWLDLVDLADMAMYAAKRAGRNGWVGLFAGNVQGPEGLLQRLKEHPQEAVQNDELRFITNLDVQEVLAALST